jgi:plastocyanin
MVHDLAIDAVSEATPLLTTGQVGAIEFTAPRRAGNYPYRCRPHGLMMRGVLAVSE